MASRWIRTGGAYVTGYTYSADFLTVSPYQSVNRSAPGERDVFVARFDPSGAFLVFSTYLGGRGGRDEGSDVALDPSGNIYVTGTTHSLDFPVTPGAFQTRANSYAGDDGFVTKFSPDGRTLLYSSYLAAASTRAAFEWPRAIAVDAAGNAYVTGEVDDSHFPTTPGVFQPTSCGSDFDRNTFVTKLNAAGSALVYSTYLCGNGFDAPYGLAIDDEGNAYITGRVCSIAFPLVGSSANPYRGECDAFVTKMNATGTGLLYSTYLGGGKSDAGTAITVDSSRNAYITGRTNSSDFPLLGPAQSRYGGGSQACGFEHCGDAFVTKLDPSGRTLYSTYVGGRDDDGAYGIAVDGAGRATIVGATGSNNFPLVNPIQGSFGGVHRDAFVTTLSTTGHYLEFSTYLGGNATDDARAVAADFQGNLYVTGYTYSVNFPALNPIQHKIPGDNSDLFVTKIQAPESGPPPPPPGPYLTSAEFPDFRFKVRIVGTTPIDGVQESRCIPETLCVSGALPGRSEVFLRIVGPKPNGFLWPTLVKFTTSEVEVWIEQLNAQRLRYYRLAGAGPNSSELEGLFDRNGFPAGGSADAGEVELAVGASDEVGLALSPAEAPPLPPGPFLTSTEFPDFRFKVRITGGSAISGAKESRCIAETLCVSGAIPGRSEVFLRIVGPKPNGYLWPTLVKFTTSQVEVWIEQLSTGSTNYYLLEGAGPESSKLPGLFDREGFLP